MSHQKWSEKLQSDRKNLQHHDLEVLAIEVVETTRGEIIKFLINQLANTVGKPVQIISDHGSDLKKGIELYITENQLRNLYLRFHTSNRFMVKTRVIK